MTALITAELRRLRAGRMWIGLLLTPAALGLVLTGAMTLAGPENFEPPLPGIDSEDGVRALLGMLGISAFLPAAIGTYAVTAEYRHRTIDTTFMYVPRRGRVLVAKLLTYTVAGIAYGLLLAGGAAIGLFGGAALRGEDLGLPAATLLGLFARIGVAMAVYMLLGVGVGALLRNQVAALAVVIGYLYMGETLLMLIPGVKAVYPVLPGGATAALTDFTYVADALAQQTASEPVRLLSPVAGALILIAYAMAAAVAAIRAPLRRDVV